MAAPLLRQAGGLEGFLLGAEELPPDRHRVPVADDVPDRLRHLNSAWVIRGHELCEHAVTEVSNLVGLAAQPTEWDDDLPPPPPDPIMPSKRLAFGLGDQRGELHVGVDAGEERIEVTAVHRVYAAPVGLDVLLRHRPRSIPRHCRGGELMRRTCASRDPLRVATYRLDLHPTKAGRVEHACGGARAL